MKTSISTIELNQEILLKNINFINYKQGIIVDQMNNITQITIPQIFQELNKVSLSQMCMMSEMSYAIQAGILVIGRIPDKIYRILMAGQTGTISFDVLPYDLLLEKVMPQFPTSSPYYQDPTLMYHLGKFTITHITHHPFVISGILSYPDLSLEYKGVAYSTTVVPIHIGGRLGILEVPAMVVQGDDSSVWIPNNSRCEDTHNVIVCPINMIHEDKNECFSSLFSGLSQASCRVIDVTSFTPMVRHTSGGLLVGASNETIRLIKHTLDNVPIIKDERLPGYPILIQADVSTMALYRNMTYIVVSSPLISLTPVVIREGSAINMSELVPSIIYDKIEKGNNIQDIHHTAHYTYAVIIAILYIGLCIAIYLKYHHIEKRHHQLTHDMIVLKPAE